MDTEIPGLIPFLCPISSMYPVLAHRVCHSPVHSLTVLINTRHTILPIPIASEPSQCVPSSSDNTPKRYKAERMREIIIRAKGGE